MKAINKTRAPHAVLGEAENSLTCQKAYSSVQLITPKISTQVWRDETITFMNARAMNNWLIAYRNYVMCAAEHVLIVITL